MPRIAGVHTVLWLAVVVGCAELAGGVGPEPPDPTDPTPGCGLVEGSPAALFIGNSLTYSNSLPQVVEAISVAAGDARPWRTASVTAPSYSLEDHHNGGSARTTIECGLWSVVILQQGPSSLPENQLHLAHWTEVFARHIREVGAEPGLYMVWPPVSRLEAFDDVYESYSSAAEAVGGRFFPVGQTWREAWRMDADLGLYSGDGFHPSVAGTYAAAVTIYAQLADRSPVGLPREFTLSDGRVLFVPARAALTIQQAAARAIEEYGR